MSDKYIVYQCLDCKQVKIVGKNNKTTDGRTCDHCKGHMIHVGCTVTKGSTPKANA